MRPQIALPKPRYDLTRLGQIDFRVLSVVRHLDVRSVDTVLAEFKDFERRRAGVSFEILLAQGMIVISSNGRHVPAGGPSPPIVPTKPLRKPEACLASPGSFAGMTASTTTPAKTLDAVVAAKTARRRHVPETTRNEIVGLIRARGVLTTHEIARALDPRPSLQALEIALYEMKKAGRLVAYGSTAWGHDLLAGASRRTSNLKRCAIKVLDLVRENSGISLYRLINAIQHEEPKELANAALWLFENDAVEVSGVQFVLRAKPHAARHLPASYRKLCELRADEAKMLKEQFAAQARRKAEKAVAKAAARKARIAAATAGRQAALDLRILSVMLQGCAYLEAAVLKAARPSYNVPAVAMRMAFDRLVARGSIERLTSGSALKVIRKTCAKGDDASAARAPVLTHSSVFGDEGQEIVDQMIMLEDNDGALSLDGPGLREIELSRALFGRGCSWWPNWLAHARTSLIPQGYLHVEGKGVGATYRLTADAYAMFDLVEDLTDKAADARDTTKLIATAEATLVIRQAIRSAMVPGAAIAETELTARLGAESGFHGAFDLLCRNGAIEVLELDDERLLTLPAGDAAKKRVTFKALSPVRIEDYAGEIGADVIRRLSGAAGPTSTPDLVAKLKVTDRIQIASTITGLQIKDLVESERRGGAHMHALTARGQAVAALYVR